MTAPGKHTPGPWEVIAPDKHHGWYVEDGLGRTVCDLYYLNAETEAVIDHDPGTYGETAANARLIAAAPDMVLTLAEIAAKADLAAAACDDEGRAGGFRILAADARAAIAKATAP